MADGACLGDMGCSWRGSGEVRESSRKTCNDLHQRVCNRTSNLRTNTKAHVVVRRGVKKRHPRRSWRLLQDETTLNKRPTSISYLGSGNRSVTLVVTVSPFRSEITTTPLTNHRYGGHTSRPRVPAATSRGLPARCLPRRRPSALPRLVPRDRDSRHCHR